MCLSLWITLPAETFHREFLNPRRSKQRNGVRQQTAPRYHKSIPRFKPVTIWTRIRRSRGRKGFRDGGVPRRLCKFAFDLVSRIRRLLSRSLVALQPNCSNLSCQRYIRVTCFADRSLAGSSTSQPDRNTLGSTPLRTWPKPGNGVESRPSDVLLHYRIIP